LEVFGEEAGGAGASGGLDDEGVPERQAVTFLEERRGDDEGHVDVDELPVAVGVNKLASLAAGHRRLELAGGDDVELLEDLGGQGTDTVAPQLGQQSLGDGLTDGLGGVVGVDEDAGVDEHDLRRWLGHRW
jgi:hypothetical protein